MLNQGPPKGLFRHVLDFCHSVSPEVQPMFLPVLPGAGDRVNECPANVERQIRNHGGEAVLGWKIWEWYGLMIEAEFHMIWRSPQGELRDITPHSNHYDRIVFLPDARLRYEGKQVNNIRQPLCNDPDVKRFIQANDAVFELLNREERASQHGEITLAGSEATEYSTLEIRKAELGVRIERRTPQRNEFCRCGSGLKAKKCCFK